MTDPLISKETRAAIFNANPNYSEISMSVGKVYVSAPKFPSWRPYQEGWIALVQSNDDRILYINLYSFDDFHIIFQHELYCNFAKTVRRESNSSLVSFQSDICVVGINFLNEGIANDFQEQLKEAAPDKKGKYGLFSLMPTPTNVTSWRNDQNFTKWLEKKGRNVTSTDQEMSTLYCEYQSEATAAEKPMRHGSTKSRPGFVLPPDVPTGGRVKMGTQVSVKTPPKRSNEGGGSPGAGSEVVVRTQVVKVKGVPALLALANRIASRQTLSQVGAG